MAHEGYGIGAVSRMSGVSPRALRLYEEAGLIAPRRMANGYRRYMSSDLDRLQEILLLRRAGVPLSRRVCATGTLRSILPHRRSWGSGLPNSRDGGSLRRRSVPTSSVRSNPARTRRGSSVRICARCIGSGWGTPGRRTAPPPIGALLKCTCATTAFARITTEGLRAAPPGYATR